MNNSSPPVDWAALCAASLVYQGTPPADEWWYSLEPNETDAARMANIERSAERYAQRFGCRPGTPRVVMIGKTPVLAYPAPVSLPTQPPMTTIIDDPAEVVMQLSLL